MDNSTKILIAALAILVIFTPLGLLAVGETFGEWGTEYFEEKLGYVPPGLEGLSSLWSAPMPDYGIPGLGDTTVGSAAGYVLSAIIGSVVVVGLIYGLGKILVKDSSN